jgi:DNA-binding LacI/PurR family transcriptional regulator
MITLKDIASRLGLSASTVGRALAGDRRISEASRARVAAEAARLGYVPHEPARMMRGRRSNLVGLAIPDIDNAFYSSVARALSDVCDAAGYQVALSITDDDPDVELRKTRGLVGARAAGLVMVPTLAPRPETIALLREAPHVFLVRDCPRIGGDWFGIDDHTALQAAAEHLIALGHRRIGYIGERLGLSTGAARHAGVRAAFVAAGMSTDDLLVETGPPQPDFAKAALARLLADTRPPTAIIMGGVRLTMGALDGLDQAEAEVPRDVSIVGYGDAPWFARWRGRGLTTLTLPVRQVVAACAARLIDRLAAEAARGPACRSAKSAELVIRGSTGPPTKQSRWPSVPFAQGSRLDRPLE